METSMQSDVSSLVETGEEPQESIRGAFEMMDISMDELETDDLAVVTAHMWEGLFDSQVQLLL